MDSGDAYTDNRCLHNVMQYQYRNNNTFTCLDDSVIITRTPKNFPE